MSILENFYKLLTALMPAYFYFVPALLIPVIYKKYIKKTYNRLGGKSLDGYERVKYLEDNIGRLLSFVSFLSIYIGLILNLVWASISKEINAGLLNLICLILFIILGAIVIRKNLNAKEYFNPQKIWVWFEIVLVIISVYIIAFVL